MTDRYAPRSLLAAGLGVAAIAISARITVTLPGSQVPQSAQTLAVLLVGSLLGARQGSMTLVLYLLVGSAGAPVFADGGSGWRYLTGPTSGYLLGFLAAGSGVGWLADRGGLMRPLPALCAMVGARALILALGWARLAWSLGPEAAYGQGVRPFLVGGLIKSLVAAGVVVIGLRWTNRSERSG